MNYRHGYHAGNFADVVKHVALVAILQHLKKKDAAFAVVDSHAGRGAYDLGGAEAAKTGEANSGIARLAGLTGNLPEALAAYLSLVKECGVHFYPGSPMIAAKLLRPQDRLTAIEKHPAEFATLKEALAPFRNAVAEQDDGYARAIKLLPPPSRRGLVLLDPPFEAPDEFSALAQIVRGAVRKFATGIFLVWYPIKSQAAADAFTGEILAGGMTKAMTLDTAITALEGKLGRAGLLVINPPYGFDAAMRATAGIIAPLLGATITTVWLAGAE
ncbi:MAG TPA: 23S rRNA (adenine(2030)-N(6))-methyltransferase RlmJ [Rhizomicrobium sp.]|nr:23S rRNA (adenine(2030)-N(6))-methyltransferase RlmJ [Rhizomicrobium sp.]